MKGAEPIRETSSNPRHARGKPGFRLIRYAIGGVLMGLANLVPGVSGGTMILIMGLYDEFVSAVADATRLVFSRWSLVFLGVVASCAALTIVSLAGPLAQLVTLHPAAMYALFIGMTLGGVPLLWCMVRPVGSRTAAAMVTGVLIMIAIAAARPDRGEIGEADRRPDGERVDRGEIAVRRAYGLDVAAGVLGMSAMVLPGISGAYMLLLLGRYEQILNAISLTKEYVFSQGESGDPSALHVIVPVAIGAIVSLVGVTNLLKWLLHRHQKTTIALLLGILVGSVVTLWRMIDVHSGSEYVEAGVLSVVGFGLTVGLSRIGTRPDQTRG